MKVTKVAILMAITAASLAAQQNINWTDGNSPTVGGGNAFPWGSEGVRFQQIIPRSVLPSTAGWITDIFVSGRSTSPEIVYGDIEIRIGVTQQTVPAANWNTNNPNPTTVYRGPLRVKFVVDQWRAIALPKPYLWIPKTATDNLCFEVITWKVTDRGGGSSSSSNFYYPHVSASQGRAFRYQWTSNQSQGPLTSSSSGASRMGLVFNDGNFVALGSGCKGTNGTPTMGSKPGTWPQFGKAFDIDLSGGPAQRPVFLFVGIDATKWSGIPMPLDLKVIGAPSCMAWHDQLFVMATATDASGAATAKLVVPSIGHIRLLATWWCLDTQANALGITTSGYGAVIY